MSDDTRVLEESASAGGYHHNVVDLASVRIAVGMPKRDVKRCEHTDLIYSSSERLIECRDCKRAVEPFDAFLMITRHFERMSAELNAERRRVDEAAKAVIHRRAAKELERTWHSMAAICPHCRGGILPEDGLGSGAISRELELARRKRDAPPQ